MARPHGTTGCRLTVAGALFTLFLVTWLPTAPLSLIERRAKRTRAMLRFFRKQRVRGFTPPRRPFVDSTTEDWLTCELKKAELFLEFGSGGSTMLANRMRVPTISVESDRFYAAAVRSALKFPHICQILAPSMGITRQWGMPVFFKSAKGLRYVRAPFEHLGDRFPDLIFVDGRYRVACVMESARQAAEASATSTLLLDDYRQRPHYHVLEEYLGTPERIGKAAKFVIGHVTIRRAAVRRYSRDAR